MRSSAAAARLAPARGALQGRTFYLGAQRGAHGRHHEAVVGSEGLWGLDEKLDRGSWKAAWGQGPLYEKVRDEDEAMAYKRYVRQVAEVHEKARHYGALVNDASKQQQAHAVALSKARVENERLYEARFNLEESWEGRASVDFEKLSEDTLTRLYVWRVFGGMDGWVSPPTYDMARFVQEAYDDCVARGELPLAEQRNLEFWCELMVSALREKKSTLYKGAFPDTFVGFSNDLINKIRSEEPELKDAIPAHRQVLTGAFINPPGEGVEVPFKGGLEKLSTEALGPFLPVMRWYLGQDVPQKQQSKQHYLAGQKLERRVRAALVKEITGRPGCSRSTVEGLEREIQRTDDALEQVARNDAVWQRMLPQLNKPLGKELAHLLSAVPVHPEKLPYPTTDTASDDAHRFDVADSFQHQLSELLATPVYKKCLLADATDGTRNAVYEVAWLQTKERGHDVYSEQRAEINGLLQRARRKLDETCRYVMDEPQHAALFSAEHNMSDRKDTLYAPDAYSTDLQNVTIRTEHEHFTTGGFLDNSPGVRA